MKNIKMNNNDGKKDPLLINKNNGRRTAELIEKYINELNLFLKSK